MEVITNSLKLRLLGEHWNIFCCFFLFYKLFSRKFEDLFDLDHFIDYLKDKVQIVRDIPSWFTDKSELFTTIRRTMKNIPKYASKQFYIHNVLQLPSCMEGVVHINRVGNNFSQNDHNLRFYPLSRLM
ncbi:unnamed protein product [Lactuca virosa]|uniref:O-fucosyltransferase family protein n=1 Tax=Lactuca virosa TaxID=75947 RepID=A0AAU9N3D3_9ASTR|nr:unnamed protein product [Lactuca virosa]